MGTSDLIREKIYETIKESEDELWLSKIADKLDLSPSTVSNHIDKMEENGKVKTEKKGRLRIIKP